jgi:hypothetical protein
VPRDREDATSVRQHVVGSFSLQVDPAPDSRELAEWDQLVRTTPGTDVTQSSAWARVRALVGYSPLYLFVRQEGRLVAGYQLLYRRVLGMGRVGYVPYGPVAALGRRPPGMSELLANTLRHLGARRFRLLIVQPSEGDDQLRSSVLGVGFRPSRVAIAPTGYLRVDVQVDESELRARARRRLRSAQKLWDKHGVSVREGDERDLPILARLLECSARVHGFEPYKLDYLRKLYSELAPTGQVFLLVGEADGVPLVADLLTVNANMLRGRLVGFDRSGHAPQSAVPAAVTWAGITWAREHRLRWYDMGGLSGVVLSDMLDRGLRYSPDWPSTALAKLGWGGTPFRYPAPVELVRPKALRLAHELFQESPVVRSLMSKAAARLRG